MLKHNLLAAHSRGLESNGTVHFAHHTRFVNERDREATKIVTTEFEVPSGRRDLLFVAGMWGYWYFQEIVIGPMSKGADFDD
jgi:hypothetical protein